MGSGCCERIWATSVLSLIDKTPGTLHGNTGHLAPGNIGIIRTKHGTNPHPAIMQMEIVDISLTSERYLRYI